MRKFCFCFVIVILSAVAANAAPKAEIFGGYQYTHFDGGPNMNGWNGALTGNFNSWFGVLPISAAYMAPACVSTPTPSDRKCTLTCLW
jgi:hypothetical protein